MSDDKMREAFEVFAKDRGLATDKLCHGDYRQFSTGEAWEAWQTALSQQPESPESWPMEEQPDGTIISVDPSEMPPSAQVPTGFNPLAYNRKTGEWMYVNHAGEWHLCPCPADRTLQVPENRLLLETVSTIKDEAEAALAQQPESEPVGEYDGRFGFFGGQKYIQVRCAGRTPDKGTLLYAGPPPVQQPESEPRINEYGLNTESGAWGASDGETVWFRTEAERDRAYNAAHPMSCPRKLSRTQGAPQALEGWKLVPLRATREIEDAIARGRHLKACEIWGDAVAAAPSIEEKNDE